MAYFKRPDEQDNPVCPVCGRDLGWMDKIITSKASDYELGCTLCLALHDANEWFLYGPKMFEGSAPNA